MTTDDLTARLARAASRLVMIARQLEWRGPDPYDGLYWSWSSLLTATPFLRQVITQLHARSPVDIRAWRTEPGPRIAKTLALFSTAAILTDEASPMDELRSTALETAWALCDERSSGEAGCGYPFMVQTRWSSYPANSPNVVVTSFAIDALDLAGQRLREPAFTRRAADAGDWLLTKLLTPRGHFAYHRHSTALIHNANLLGAAAVYRSLREREVVLPAIELTLEAQRADGSWPYGEGSGLSFVDSFHTAYILRSLASLRELDPAIDGAIERGAAYWSNHFFDEAGRAMLWPDRRYPEDAHSAGAALTTLALLARRESAWRALLTSVASRTVSAMIRGGRAVHRRYRWGSTRVQYLRWCDGHVAAGMAAAALAIGGQGGA